jgi:hypothetical protein
MDNLDNLEARHKSQQKRPTKRETEKKLKMLAIQSPVILSAIRSKSTNVTSNERNRKIRKPENLKGPRNDDESE